MHRREVLWRKVVVGCALALALPGSAHAAPATFAGPASVGERAEKASYTFDCGDGLLPPSGDTGALTVTVTGGPGEPASDADRGLPSPLALACGPLTRQFTIDVAIFDDAADEPDETFTVTVSGTLAVGGAVSTSVSTTIIDDDAAPPISGSGPEGSGAGDAATGGTSATALPTLTVAGPGSAGEGERVMFTVNLSRPVTGDVRVGVATVAGSATRADFVPGTATLAFGAGQTAKIVSVDVLPDRIDERNEVFAVSLQDPVGATIAHRSASITIMDDDGPKVSIRRPKTTRRAIVTRIACPATADACMGRLHARTGKFKVGAARFALAGGETAKVKVKLSRKARKALRSRALRVRLRASAADASGARRTVTRKYRVRRVR